MFKDERSAVIPKERVTNVEDSGMYDVRWTNRKIYKTKLFYVGLVFCSLMCSSCKVRCYCWQVWEVACISVIPNLIPQYCSLCSYIFSQRLAYPAFKKLQEDDYYFNGVVHWYCLQHKAVQPRMISQPVKSLL